MPALIGKLLILSVLLLGMPVLGIAISGETLAPYLQFPPRTQPLVQPPFSWPLFVVTALVALSLLIVLGSLTWRDLRARQKGMRTRHARAWPWWGWLGVLLLGLSWLLAWTRFDWFASWQAYTFTPLWLGYILLINAWTLRISARCLITERPAFMLALFPLSALFWWYFEFLNRFVRNWYYLGIEHFDTLQYMLHATLAFSTVLLAVLSTTELLAALLRPAPRPLAFKPTRRFTRGFSVLVLIISALGLTGLGIWPQYLFPLLWLAPLLLLLALQGLVGEPPLITRLREAGWQILYLPALAALLCGVYWELWNYYSLAKWVYSIPFVQQWHIFEMPLLGYAGYLPFGIECYVIALLLARRPARIAA